jgi:hypothetical protein
MRPLEAFESRHSTWPAQAALDSTSRVTCEARAEPAEESDALRCSALSACPVLKPWGAVATGKEL